MMALNARTKANEKTEPNHLSKFMIMKGSRLTISKARNGEVHPVNSEVSLALFSLVTHLLLISCRCHCKHEQAKLS